MLNERRNYFPADLMANTFLAKRDFFLAAVFLCSTPLETALSMATYKPLSWVSISLTLVDFRVSSSLDCTVRICDL